MAKSRDTGSKVSKKPSNTLNEAKNWFLGIAIDSYPHYKQLSNATRDMQEVHKELVNKYGYSYENSKTLVNHEATYDQIFIELEALKHKIGDKDSLIIFFAGHGNYNPKTDKGAWLPFDAEKNSKSRFLPNSIIVDFLLEISALHILIIADTCFSGSMLYARTDNNEHLPIDIPSRWVLSSGRFNDLVNDGVPGEHSPFTRSFLYHLRQNTNPKLSIQDIGDKVTQMTVRQHEGQYPQCAPLLIKSHQGGHFIFHLLDLESILWKQCLDSRDFNFVQEFIEKYPQSEHVAEAHQLKQAIEKELTLQNILDNENIDQIFAYLLTAINEPDLLKIIERLKELSDKANKIEDNFPTILDEKIDEDFNAWQKANTRNTVQQYNEYLQKYPYGKYVIWARSARAKIMDQYRQEQEKGEILFWKTSIGQNTITSYKNYIAKYPNGQYIKLAYEKLDNLIHQDLTKSFIEVKGGAFVMGDLHLQNSATKLEVELDSFLISNRLVVVEDYMHFVNKAKYEYPIWHVKSSFHERGAFVRNHVSFSHDRAPIVGISWFDALEYCNWLSAVHHLAKVYKYENGQYIYDQKANGFRLLTEAEWEYAAKGGALSRRFIFSGSNQIEEAAWFKNNSIGYLHEIKCKKSNELGIYDMSGNVWEWCWDRFAVLAQNNWLRSNRKIMKNPIGSMTGLQRVIRGGAYSSPSEYCRVYHRNSIDPITKSTEIGFRISRTKV